MNEPLKVTLYVDFRIGDTVYLKCGDSPGIVTRFAVMPNEVITYEISWGTGASSYHYGLEMTAEKPLHINADSDE